VVTLALFGAFVYLVVLSGGAIWWRVIAGVVIFVLWFLVPGMLDQRDAEKEQRKEDRAFADQPALREVPRREASHNVALLRRELAPGERVLLAVPSNRQRGVRGGGLVAVTTERLLFIGERIFREPVRISVRADEIIGAAVEESSGAVFGNLDVRTSGEGFTFAYIQPTICAWELLGHLLAQIEDSGEGGFQPEAVTADTGEAADAAAPIAERELPQVHVTPEAADEIRRRGGSLYLWQADFGHDLAIDKLDTKAPDASIRFSPLEGDGWRLMIDARLGLPSRLDVDFARVPYRRFKVDWDDARWGRRGVGLE
jgi:hypothetical protein